MGLSHALPPMKIQLLDRNISALRKDVAYRERSSVINKVSGEVAPALSYGRLDGFLPKREEVIPAYYAIGDIAPCVVARRASRHITIDSVDIVPG